MSQTRFDLALPADVRFGPGRVGEIPAALAGLGVRRVLVVTGRVTTRADGVRAALTERGMASEVLAVSGEPTVDVVRAAVSAAVAAGIDGFLGYGGGSALDVAKAVAILATHGTDPLDHLEVVGRGVPFSRPALPCVAVPTTAGTGSEVTRNAVLSAGGVKASLRSPLMVPKVAVVDPDLLAGLPAPTVVAGGLDALTQLIEPFLSVRANPVTDGLAREGMRRSARSLPGAVLPGPTGAVRLDTDPEVREDLALASLLGGCCLASAGLGAVHGFAAAVGGRFPAPHGAVCAALLVPTLDVTFRALAERAPDHPALARGSEVAALLTGRPGAAVPDLLGWLAQLVADLAVPGLARHGVTPADLADVVTAAARASSMRAHPLELTTDELTEIAARAL